MSASPTNAHPLHENIAKHQIRRVAVVDDAFDKVTVASFQEGEDREFVDALNAEDELLVEYHRVVSGVEHDSILLQQDLTDEVAALLWDKRQTLTDSLKRTLAATLFRVLERKVTQVELLCSFLKDQLGIERIERFGTGDRQPNDAFDMAFIDYRFGPSRQAESVDRAVRWATHLYQNGRTFIILMSSETEARIRQEYFRGKSDLTRGLFEFLDKEEIEDNGKICNRLNSFCAGLKTRHEIHKFATVATAAAGEALSALKQSIQALGIEDYAYLEQISLRDDGHPLGDYMLWLWGEYFAHNLAVNALLQDARKSVNTIQYDRFLPLQRPPSVMLAKMYSAAITEPVYEGWGPHPRTVQHEAEIAAVETAAARGEACEGDKTLVPSATDLSLPSDAAKLDSLLCEDPLGEEVLSVTEIAFTQSALPSPESLPLYQLGDLLVATKDKPAYLVLNAACDLQFSPGSRDCDINQSILLIPGRFEQLYEQETETNVKRTELFELGGEKFRIVWQHTRAVAVPHCKILREYQSQGYERKWRLKLPYALEVQQHFASQLTRIGVPTPTPVFRERPVEVYGKDASGDCHHLGTVPSGLVVFHHRNHDQFVLTVDCVHQVLTLIDSYVVKVENELKEPAGVGVIGATHAEESALPITGVPTSSSGKRGGPPERNPAKEAEKRTQRRKKYADLLKETRDALALNCSFQASLCEVPSVGSAVFQIDDLSNAEQHTRLEVRHQKSLTGRFLGNAPVILTFSNVDHPINGVEHLESPALHDQTVNISSKGRPQP